MRKIKVTVNNGFHGCDKTHEFEVEDDATDEQIDEAALEILFELIDWSWIEIN